MLFWDIAFGIGDIAAFFEHTPTSMIVRIRPSVQLSDV